MGALSALGQILLGAIPTFILLWILYFYTTRVFFGPFEKILSKRHESTAGLQKTAATDLAKAEQKTAEYQEALRTARAEIYRLQEQERQRALDQKAETVRQAHQRAEELVKSARQQIGNDVDSAKKGLAADAEQIAASITRAILKPPAVSISLSGGSEVSR